MFAGAVVVIEDGYTVKTVIDGHKLEINPHSVMLRPGSSDLVVLDSSGSAFYTVRFPPSKGTDENEPPFHVFHFRESLGFGV